MTARTNDLECWKLFCLVVEKQGLNAAADFADIEPSRLSRVINSLEAELGSPLLGTQSKAAADNKFRGSGLCNGQSTSCSARTDARNSERRTKIAWKA